MTPRNSKPHSLTYKIVIGLLLGTALGVALNIIGVEGFIKSFVVDGLLHVGGQIFFSSLKLLVVPLVFVSLVCGTAALEDVRKLGRIGGKTLGLYLFTTAAAIALAIFMAVIVEPGAAFNLRTGSTFDAKAAPALTDVIINMVPTNPIKAMADGKMLQIIVFAILFGFALNVTGKPGERLQGVFKDLNEVIMRLVLLVMHIAPYGVFCLIAKVFALQGFKAILPLGQYFFLVLFVLFLHATVTYSAVLKFFSGLNPIQFFRRVKDAPFFAFSTASSGATLPVTLETVEYKLGVKNSIASFTVPLGATVNMDGTAIMQGVATAFIAQAYGIDIGIGGYLTVILMATLASVGTAAVPGVGLITLAMVLRQVNVPVEGIGLIIGVDRLLDMTRTAVNVVGDSVVSCVVAKSEKQFSKEIFNGKDVVPSVRMHPVTATTAKA